MENSREKQIEEMAEIITNADLRIICKGQPCLTCEFAEISKNCYTAKALYNAGYRKASEVAREIFEEIDKGLDSITIVMGVLDSLRTFHKTIEKVTAEIAELKKKYESEKDNG